MDYLEILLFTIAAYLIGAFPSSIILSKWVYGIDIRDHGAGNASHSNVHQIMGMRPGLVVQILDTLKGLLAASLALMIHTKYGIFSEWEYPVLMMSFGLAALIGHIFPVFAGFRGGKGYHVTVGVLLAINPLATVVVLAFSLLVLLIFRYPTLAYASGGLGLLVFALTFGKQSGWLQLPMLIFSSSACLMLILTYRQEIRGVLEGSENRIHFLQRRK